MSSKIILLIVVAVILVSGGITLAIFLTSESEETGVVQAKCATDEMIFYYRNGCSWCGKVKTDNSIPQLEELGVTITQVETTTGSVQHQISGVPAFVVNNEVFSGYRTYAQLKELLGCTE
ncbi:MAG: hypothetical protein ABIB97_00060 [Patescibacteria group bacterium]